jgi:EmrB/QacA subfamily drug resistance transporter
MNASVSAFRPRAATPLLVVVCLAQFMVILDVSIVNVALPSIRGSLHFSTTGLQWVVNAYTLTFAGFLLLGGRCADLIGRRPVFLAGTILFSASSLLCALATSRGLLIGARALQGFGGAVLSPATLSIVTGAFREGPERNRALGLWGAMGALGGSSGALLGGVLTQVFGWSAIFAINVPLGALVVVLGSRLVPVTTGDRASRRHFDVLGAVLITASLVSLTFGIVRTDTSGWGSTAVLAPLGLGVLLLAAFAFVEGRIAAAPLIPLPALRIGHLRAANLVVLLLYGGFFPVWFFLTIYLQQVKHLDAIEAGLSFLPMTLSIFAASTLAPRLVARWGSRRVIASGMLTAATGMLLLTGVAPGGSYASSVLPGALLSAIGMGCSLVPATIVAMQGLPRDLSGLGSGLLNTSRLMGGALGLAVLSTIADARTHAAAHVASGAQALTDGFGIAFLVGASFALAGAVIAALLLGRARGAGPVAAEDAAVASAEPVVDGEVLAA